MNASLCSLAAVAILIGSAASACAMDDTEAAYAVCQKMERLGVPSDDCVVDEWAQSVTVTYDLTRPEGRKICFEVIQRFRGTHQFEEPWTLEIKSPDAGDSPIARCQFL